MDILYVGPDAGTSRHRLRALGRLGHHVDVVDPRRWVGAPRWLARWTWRTGALGLSGYVRARVLAALPARHWDVAMIDGGELVGPALVRDLRQRCGAIANYNVDDPYGRRDGARWRLYLQAVPLYDLIVVVRQVNVAEAYARGARRVLRVYRSADEEAHAPRRLTAEDRQRWDHDVLFVGTWMPGRGAFAAELLCRGVPLAIYGDGWQKAPEWGAIRPAWRGPAIYGDEYAKAVGTARVCLGLLSKGNRDLHTQRTMEIPFAGGLLCAERTVEHSALYREDHEALFWEDAHECAERCREVVGRPARGSAIARSGQERCIANGHLNERVMAQILDWLGGGLRPPSETSPREQIAPAEPALERAAIGRSRPGHRAIASAARSRGANAQPARDVDRAADRFTNSRWAADGRTPRPWRPVGDLRHA